MLTNQDIEVRVMDILNAIPKESKIKPADEKAIMSGVILLINLLQNINTIANNSGN